MPHRTLRPLPLAGLVGLLAVSLTGCGDASVGDPTSPPSPGASSAALGTGIVRDPCPQSAPAPRTGAAVVTLTTDKGVVRVRVPGGTHAGAAFTALARCGYYEQTVFYRLRYAYGVSGGDGQFGRTDFIDETKIGTGSPGFAVPDGVPAISYPVGTVVLERSAAPESGGARFAVVLNERFGRDLLASGRPYEPVGTVIEGLDVLDAISAMPNSGGVADLPLEPVSVTATSAVDEP